MLIIQKIKVISPKHSIGKFTFHSINILIKSTIIFCLLFSSCGRKKVDPSKITVRPRIFIEGAAPVPILDEYDFTGVQLGTFADVFSENQEGRIFALWLSTDRRAAITLQKETSRNIGKRLSLVSQGRVIAVHPIEKAITNGYIPFLFINKISEQQVMLHYKEFEESLVHLKAELQSLKN